MLGKRRGCSDADPERVARVSAIVDELMQRYGGVARVDVSSVERTYPALMPELGERLRALQAMEEARDQVLGEAQRQPPTDQADPSLEEDLEFLRRSLDSYEVLERIRFGGQGVVYRARQKGTKRLVAIKVLLDGPLASERQRYLFEREIELVSRLRHPNIITVHDAGIIRGRHYFAMDFVEGLPIDDYVLLNDLTPRGTVRLFTKVCQAVSYAHQNGVIHRDLSPANILVDESGEPRVFDFGLAKDAWASGDALRYSLSGQVFGTLQYLSPEQAGGLDGEVDVRSDIYTLGIVLYELLTDGFPYPVKGEPREVLDAILTAEPEPLRKAAKRGGRERMRELDSINRDLEVILAKALAKEKDKRYQSVAEFSDDLTRCLAGAAISARADSHFYLLRKTIRRYRVAAGIAAVILLTLSLSWMQVRAQRDNARAAVEAAFDLFEGAYDVEEAVRGLPGGLIVRDQFVAELSSKIPALEALVGADEALDPIRTRLLEKRGDIACQQGQAEDAARYFQAFLTGCLRLAESEPSNQAYLDDAVRANRKCAEVSPDPETFYERAIQLGAEVLSRDPRREEMRYNLCQTHVSFGEHLERLNYHARALKQFEAALALCTSDAPATAERWATLVARAKDRRGRALLTLGEGAAGLAELAASLQLREQVLESHPADTQLRHDLMLAYLHMATAQRDAGQPDEAKRFSRLAIALGELLSSMDPSVVRFKFDLYTAYDKLARLYLVEGELTEAEAVCDNAMALADELAQTAGHTTEGSSKLAFAHRLRGRLLLERDAPEEAYKAFQREAAIREALLANDPENPALKDRFAGANNYLAKASRKMGKHEQASRHYQLAYNIYSDLHREQPQMVEGTLDLIRSQTNLAVVHLDFETEAEDAIAAELLQEGDRLLKSLHTSWQLVGLEGTYQTLSLAIDANLAEIRERAQQRSTATASHAESGSPD